MTKETANDFGYVYKSAMMDGASSGNFTDQDLANIQPGDIIYYRWADGDKNYPVHHTEMYAGNNERIGHGGPGYGPTIKPMSSSSSRIYAIKRYLPFLKGEQPPFWNVDGTQGVYSNITKPGIAAATSSTATNALTNVPLAYGRSRSGKSKGNKSNNLILNGRRNAFRSPKANRTKIDISELRKLQASKEDTSGVMMGGDDDIAGINRDFIRPLAGSSRSGRALSSAVSYEDFLNVIIELLTIIAKNSDNLTAILNLLSKTYNTTINPSDVTAASDSKSAQSRLRHALRHSGLSRAASGTSGGGEGANGYGGINERSQNDIQYVIGLMESLAKA